MGSLIFTIVEKKPYVLGVQPNAEQIQFFERETLYNIKRKWSAYLEAG